MRRLACCVLGAALVLLLVAAASADRNKPGNNNNNNNKHPNNGNANGNSNNNNNNHNDKDHNNSGGDNNDHHKDDHKDHNDDHKGDDHHRPDDDNDAHICGCDPCRLFPQFDKGSCMKTHSRCCEKNQCCRTVSLKDALQTRDWPHCDKPYAFDDKKLCINSCHKGVCGCELPFWEASKCRVIGGDPCVSYGCDCAFFQLLSLEPVFESDLFFRRDDQQNYDGHDDDNNNHGDDERRYKITYRAKWRVCNFCKAPIKYFVIGGDAAFDKDCDDVRAPCDFSDDKYSNDNDNNFNNFKKRDDGGSSYDHNDHNDHNDDNKKSPVCKYCDKCNNPHIVTCNRKGRTSRRSAACASRAAACTWASAPR